MVWHVKIREFEKGLAGVFRKNDKLSVKSNGVIHKRKNKTDGKIDKSQKRMMLEGQNLFYSEVEIDGHWHTLWVVRCVDLEDKVSFKGHISSLCDNHDHKKIKMLTHDGTFHGIE